MLPAALYMQPSTSINVFVITGTNDVVGATRHAARIFTETTAQERAAAPMCSWGNALTYTPQSPTVNQPALPMQQRLPSLEKGCSWGMHRVLWHGAEKSTTAWSGIGGMRSTCNHQHQHVRKTLGCLCHETCMPQRCSLPCQARAQNDLQEGSSAQWAAR